MTFALAKSPDIDLVKSNESFSNQVDETAFVAHRLIEELSKATDSEILHIRKAAEKLGIYAWILECACDAELWKRHYEFKPAPGRSDIEGTGIVSAVKRHAEEFGYSPKTIRENYRIFRTFKDQLNETVKILPEKSFYIIALKYKENPLDALELFLQERKKNPHFRPIDAKRTLSLKIIQDRNTHISESVVEDDNVKHHIDLVIARINEFKREAPDKRLVTAYYEEWCRQLKEYLEDYAVTVNEEKVLRAIERGNHKESQIASYTQLPLKTVNLILNELEERGDCESVFQRGETEVARGGHIKLWHKIGEPTGDIFSHQQTPQIKFFGEEDDSLDD